MFIVNFIFGGVMTNIGKTSLKNKILNEKLVEGYDNLDKQITANGVDFRLAAVREVLEAGELRIDKSLAKKPKLGKAWVMKGYENYIDGLNLSEVEVCTEGTLVSLDKLKPYLVVSCEKVNTPRDYNFKIECRSSLFRLTQSVLETAFGEAGYCGTLTFLMFSLLDTKIDLGVRFAQVVFSKLDSDAHYEEQAESSYQGGKVL